MNDDVPVFTNRQIQALLNVIALALREADVRSAPGQSSAARQDIEAYARLLLEVPLDKDPTIDPSQLEAASRTALGLVHKALDLSRDPMFHVLHRELQMQRAMRGRPSDPP